MPVVKRKDKRRHGWDAEDRLHLLRGCSYFGTLAGCGEFGRFSDLPKNQARAKLVREAWDDLGEELTKQYVANHPGCRRGRGGNLTHRNTPVMARPGLTVSGV